LKCLLIFGIILHGFGWLPTLERVSYGRTALWGLSPSKTEKLYAEGYYDSALWVNAHLPPSSQILFLGETKSYLFKRNVIAPSVNNEHWISEKIRDCKTADGFYEEWKHSNVTHLLLNRQELLRLKGMPMFFWKKDARIIFREFWNRHLDEIYSSGPITIYVLVENSSRPPPIPEELEQIFNANE